MLQNAAEQLLFGNDAKQKAVALAGSDTALLGFRLNAPRRSTVRLLVNGAATDVDYDLATLDEPTAPSGVVDHDAVIFFGDGAAFETRPFRASGAAGGGEGDGAIISPMPGKIIAVDVRQGDVVAKGAKLVTLEAMKMEHSLTATFDGIVAELNAVEGGQVTEGTLLARIEKAES